MTDNNSYNSQSKKGRRMRGLANTDDSYNYYKKLCDEPISNTLYLKIVNDFMKFIMEMVREGHSVVLPARMGIIGVLGRRQVYKTDNNGNMSGLAPDWKKTKELWARCEECREKKEMVYYINEGTNGIKYKIFWSKKDILTPNKTIYALQFSRANKRAISNKIKEGQQYPILLPKIQKYARRNKNSKGEGSIQEP